MPLHLKYRPSSVEDVLGNASAVEALQKWAEKKPEDRPRSLLFVGPSGCGKTTLARIVGSLAGVAEPDFMEVDSADYRGIDSVREIRKQMSIRPLVGSCRAWLLDECHKMTNDAQSALLKALEDTPKHVLFLLATTDPQKLLPTIRNRCTQFTVVQLPQKEITNLLRKVCRAERKRVDDDVLDQISEECLGSPRAALVMLDKVIDLDKDEQLAAAKKAASEQGQTIDLCRALIGGSKWTKVSALLKEMQDQDPEAIRRSVLGYMNSTLLKEANNQAMLVMKAFQFPTYDMGWPAVTLACYEIVVGGK